MKDLLASISTHGIVHQDLDRVSCYIEYVALSVTLIAKKKGQRLRGIAASVRVSFTPTCPRAKAETIKHQIVCITDFVCSSWVQSPQPARLAWPRPAPLPDISNGSLNHWCSNEADIAMCPATRSVGCAQFCKYAHQKGCGQGCRRRHI